MSSNPHLLFCPYLSLASRVEIGDWTVGPSDDFAGPWLSAEFESRAREFLSKFQDADGQPIKNPSLIWRRDRGEDGVAPTAAEYRALQLGLHLALLDTNPPWQDHLDGNWIATSDNSDLFVWPLDVARGSIGTVRGAIVKVLTGGHNISDPRFAVRAPLELHIPMRMRLNGELGTALYSILLDESADGDLAKRIGTAIRWLAKSWRNTVSLGAEDQVVMIRTALEALTGTSKTRRAIAWLEQTFDALRQHGAHDARFTEHLLWSPDERPTREITLPGRDGKPETHAVTDLGHWFSTFGHARHQIVHEGVVPQLTYELDGSRYNGPLFHTGERLTREAIKASLIRFGYSDLWQQEIFRALKRTIQRSGLAERLAQEPSG